MPDIGRHWQTLVDIGGQKDIGRHWQTQLADIDKHRQATGPLLQALAQRRSTKLWATELDAEHYMSSTDASDAGRTYLFLI
jgi:hypothetical protein